MKQSQKDIKTHGRAYCSNCGLLSNQKNKICSSFSMGEKIRLNHKWFYNRELNNIS